MWRIPAGVTFLATVSLAVGPFGLFSTPQTGQRPTAQAQPKRPNIVVFMADDLGWQDIELPFADTETPLNRRYRTPNLIRLASEGVKFTDAYAAAPLCTPTRVAAITGRSPAQTHVTHVVMRPNEDYTLAFPPPGPQPLLSPPWNVNGLSPTRGTPHTFSGPMLPKILRAAGYRTIHVGKAHWGALGTPGADPQALGFDVSIGGSGAGQPGSYLGQRSYRSPAAATIKMDVPGLKTYHGTETFLTEALTIEANKAIDQAVDEKRPFFLHFAQFAVHTPIQADPRFVGAYQQSGVPSVEAAYASLIEGLDKSLGDVLANIARHSLVNDTFVVFISDNGGSASSRGGAPFRHNAPLRSVKASAYEGGLRVPQVIRWPRRIKAGTTNRVPVITDDLFPTLLAIARVPDRESLVKDIRGRDLMPMLTGGPSIPADRPLLWHYPHPGGAAPGQEPFSALRVGSWKLIFFYIGRRYELYNLDNDLSESHNVLEANRSTAARLSKILYDSLREAGAQMPLDSSTKIAVDLPSVIAVSQQLGQEALR